MEFANATRGRDDVALLRRPALVWAGVFFLLFLLQVPHLVAPPEGPMLFWREALTTMVSENLAFEDGTLLRSTVDHRLPARVFAGEFPLYNALLAAPMRVFGFAHNYGRFLTFVAYCVGIFTFYHFLSLVGRPRREAVVATCVLVFSSWFTHGTRIMPDLFATVLMLGGVYFGTRYLLRYDLRDLALAAVLIAAATLSKMPVLITAGLLLPAWWGADTRRKLTFLGVAAASVAPAALWYFVWVPHLLAEGAAQLYFPTGLSEGFRHLFYDYWENTKDQFSFYVFNSTFISAIAALGLVAAALSPSWRKLKTHQFWALAVLGTLPFLIALALKSGVTFATHFYYLIPLVPVAAGLAGSVVRYLPTWAVVIVLAVAAVHGVRYVVEEDIYTPEAYLTVPQTVDRLDPSGAPIASTFDWDPRFAYYSRRNTFGLWPGQFNDAATATQLREAGVKLLVLPRWPLYEGEVPFELVGEDEVAYYYALR